MKIYLPVFTLSLLLLLSFQPLYSRTLFIKTSGNDMASGFTESNAWKTTARVNTEDLMPGDTILFEGGQIFHGGLFLDTIDTGTPDAPIVITSYGTGKAVIKLDDAGTCIYGYNVGNIDINGIDVQGPGKGSSFETNGIFFYTDAEDWFENITINNVEVTGISQKGQGIGIGAWEGKGFRNVSVTNCTVHDGSYSAAIFSYNGPGINSKHKNIYVGHCHVYNDTILSFETRNEPCMGNGILLMYIDSALIEYCVAHDGVAGGSYGIWGWGMDNSIIQHCEAYGFQRFDLGTDGGGFDIDGASNNNIIQYCYAHDNAGAGYLLWTTEGGTWGNNKVRYNISVDDGDVYGGVTFGGVAVADSPSYVYNNTIIVAPTSDAGLVCWDGEIDNSPLYFHNNIVIDKNSRGVVNDYSQGDAVFKGNLYFNPEGDLIFSGDGYSYENTDGTIALQQWQLEQEQEMNDGISCGFSADPQLYYPEPFGIVGFEYIDSLAYKLSDYKLNTGSPCIDSGLDLPTLSGLDIGDYDFWGNAPFSGISQDIGACEYLLPASSIYSHNAPKYSFKIYPVPAGNELYLQTEISCKQAIFIIVSQEGKIVQAGRHDGTATVIDISKLQPGLYSLYLPSFSVTRKFIKT